MQVAQRGTSETVSDGSNEGYSTIDRWALRFNSGHSGAIVMSQSSDAPDGFGSSTKLKCSSTGAPASSSTDFINFETRLEGQDLQQLASNTSNPKQFTVSFYMKTVNYTDPITVAFRQQSDTPEYAAVSVTPSTSWTRHSVTLTASSTGAIRNDNTGQLRLRFIIAGGSDGTYAGSSDVSTITSTRIDHRDDIGNFVDSTSNELYITGVQLEIGEQSTPFEHRSFADELARCKRYYQRWDATALDATSNKPIGAGVWYSSTQVLASFTYDEMRAAPTFTASSTGFVKAYGAGFAEPRTGGNGLNGIGTKAARFNFTCSARTAGQGTMIQMNANGDSLELDAEL